MPRTGGIYAPPSGTKGISNTPILSSAYNAFVDDLTADANAPRPIAAGGTGATTPSGALTALGGQPLDNALTSIAGLTTVADRMLYTTAADTYALATITAYGRTLIASADNAASKIALGLGTAAYKNTGTSGDAVPILNAASNTFGGNMVISGSLDLGTALAIADGGTGGTTAALAKTNLGLVAIASSGSGNDITSGTVADARLPTTMGGKIFTGNLEIQGGAPNIKLTDTTASAHDFWMHADSNSFYVLTDRDADGTWDSPHPLQLRNANSDGLLYGNQIITNVNVGNYESGYARYLRQGAAAGGTAMQFNWNGQGGQPSWLWGGNDGQQMYVYNPSNFNVNYASSAGNADTVDGLHGSQMSGVYTGSNRDETNFPVGHLVGAYFGVTCDRNQAVTVYLGANPYDYSSTVSGTPLAGTWRGRGRSGDNHRNIQRTA